MANDIDARIGERLRQARLIKEMPQETLGKALGISFQKVQKYERGVSRIRASRLWTISNVLEVPVSFFFEDLAGTGDTGAFPMLISEAGMSRRTKLY